MIIDRVLINVKANVYNQRKIIIYMKNNMHITLSVCIPCAEKQRLSNALLRCKLNSKSCIG